MRTLSLDLDMETGAVMAVGKDGRRYTLEQIDAAERAARRGDAASAAMLRAIDHGLDADGDRLGPVEVKARFEQLVHDCPECQAARARGEQPITWAAPEWAALGRPEAGPAAPLPRGSNSHARRRGRERRRR